MNFIRGISGDAHKLDIVVRPLLTAIEICPLVSPEMKQHRERSHAVQFPEYPLQEKR